MILSTLFFHSELDIEGLPSTFTVSSRRPFSTNKKNDQHLLTVPEINHIVNPRHEQGESIPLDIRRSAVHSEWAIQGRFCLKYLETFSIDPSKVLSNDSSLLIAYLWSKYFFISASLAIIYYIFVLSGILNLVWCYDVDICSDFLGLTLEEVYLYRIGFVFVTIFSYIIITVSELTVIVKNKLSHFQNFYNIIDSLIILGYWPLYSYQATNTEAVAEKWYNYITTIYLVILLYRGVIQLRCID